MYQVKYKSVAEAIESNFRCFRAKLDFDGVTVDNVGDIKWSKGSVQGDEPCIGSVVSKQGEMQVISLPDGFTLSRGMEFQLYLYMIDPYQGEESTPVETWNDLCDYTWNDLADHTYYNLSDLPSRRLNEDIPIGRFTVLSAKKNSDFYTVKFGDKLGFADEKYIPSSGLFDDMWARSDEVMADIADQLGMPFEVEEDEGYLCDKDGNRIVSNDGYYIVTSRYQFDMQEPVGYTMRQVIGFIAAMRGKFAVTDRYGRLIQRWYSSSSEALNAADENRYIDDLEISDERSKATQLVCHVADDITHTSGTDSTSKMEFDCPYMTRERLDTLYKQVPIAYNPARFTQRLGDPRLDVWDRFYYTDTTRRNLLMLNMDYTFDGGLMLNVRSGSITD